MDESAIALRQVECLAAVKLEIPAQIQFLQNRLEIQIDQRLFPAEILRRKIGSIARIDPAAEEALDECGAVGPLIGGRQICICRDECPQVFAEPEIDRRTIVERADTDVQNMPGAST